MGESDAADHYDASLLKEKRMSAAFIVTLLEILERLRDAMAESTFVSIYATPTLPAMVCITTHPTPSSDAIGMRRDEPRFRQLGQSAHS